ncbi:putative glypican-5-like [Scophthalmus maximus]|uniref:Putative glypican-5-like n=1 Tax=Scophthalmus maximus TaxID=52904 RepID=A0A2U9BKR0_SCOMX|nr:putative glypican-5-like [Scophthalmus maximus]
MLLPGDTICPLLETQERFPKLDQVEAWDELGSGRSEGSSIGCDDEDGCQASGDGQENICKCPSLCI